MDDWEVLRSAVAIFQTYDAAVGSGYYRTALVLRQEDDRPITVEGSRPPFALFLVEAGREDAKQPNSLRVVGCPTLDDAKSRAVAWLGSERAVDQEKVPMTVLIGVASVMRDPSLAAKFAP